MKTRNRQGFSIVEVLIASGIAVSVLAILGMFLVEVLRLSEMTASTVKMELAADQTLHHMEKLLRQAVLPIRLENPKGELSTMLADPVAGFGEHGQAWLKALRNGTDCLAFATPADFGGDGDFFDDNMLLELGIILPNGIHVAAGQYDETDGNALMAGGSLHPALAMLEPERHLGISGRRENLELSALRFQEEFLFPDGIDYGFALIRFVPEKGVDGNVLILSEQEIDRDINGDGLGKDTFVLGRLEVLYPYIVEGEKRTFRTRLSGPYVLLQINQESESWLPLFQLVQYEAAVPANEIEGWYHDSPKGSYALKIRLHMCDWLGQRDSPTSFGSKLRVVTKYHETILTNRIMGLESLPMVQSSSEGSGSSESSPD